MDGVPRIVLGVEGHEVAEEVMHFLDRSGKARVVATAVDERQLAEAVRQLEPDAVVASPTLVPSASALNGSVLLAVDTAESVRSLRGALRAGARGFYVWPTERDELVEAAGALPPEVLVEAPQGFVIAVYGPRGGVGTTFVATHLGSAIVRRASCILVDADLGFADLTHALGVPAEPPPRALTDILPVIDELAPQHLDEVMWEHSSGLRVLLAAGDEGQAPCVGADDVRRVVEVAARSAEVVVLHVPRGLDEVSKAALDAADRAVVVLSLDVMSFRAARRAVAAAGIEDRCEYVVNRASRSEISPRDVERVFGRPPLAVIPVDRAIAVAQDHGRLIAPRGRVGRAVDRLARRLMEERS